jgi:hypothetical protein
MADRRTDNPRALPQTPQNTNTTNRTGTSTSSPGSSTIIDRPQRRRRHRRQRPCGERASSCTSKSGRRPTPTGACHALHTHPTATPHSPPPSTSTEPHNQKPPASHAPHHHHSRAVPHAGSPGAGYAGVAITPAGFVPIPSLLHLLRPRYLLHRCRKALLKPIASQPLCGVRVLTTTPTITTNHRLIHATPLTSTTNHSTPVLAPSLAAAAASSSTLGPTAPLAPGYHCLRFAPNPLNPHAAPPICTHKAYLPPPSLDPDPRAAAGAAIASIARRGQASEQGGEGEDDLVGGVTLLLLARGEALASDAARARERVRVAEAVAAWGGEVVVVEYRQANSLSPSSSLSSLLSLQMGERGGVRVVPFVVDEEEGEGELRAGRRHALDRWVGGWHNQGKWRFVSLDLLVTFMTHDIRAMPTNTPECCPSRPWWAWGWTLCARASSSRSTQPSSVRAHAAFSSLWSLSLSL